MYEESPNDNNTKNLIKIKSTSKKLNYKKEKENVALA